MMKLFQKILVFCLAALMAVSPVLAAQANVPSDANPLESISFDASWLQGDTSVFDNRIARAAIGLAAAADKGQAEAEAILTAWGFTQVASYYYGDEAVVPILGHTIGLMTTEEGKTVAAIVFRDSKSTAEWEAVYDFAGIGNGTFVKDTHDPEEVVCFSNSAFAAQGNLLFEFLAEDAQVDHVLVCGLGRGGSCANVLGRLLTDEDFSKDVVRAYAFGAPAVHQPALTGRSSADYTNLFTVINPDDLLTYFPLAQWGFEHYGTVIETETFCDKEGCTIHAPADDMTRQAVTDAYKRYTGKADYYAYPHVERNANEKGAIITAEDLANHICSELAPTMAFYYNNTDPTLSKAPNFVYELAEEDVSADMAQLALKLLGLQPENRSTYSLLKHILSAMFSTPRDVDSVKGLLAGIYVKTELQNKPCSYSTVMDYAVRHGLHVYSLAEAINLFRSTSDLSKVTIYELLTAYEWESYLAWIMAKPDAELTVDGSAYTWCNRTNEDLTLVMADYTDAGQLESVSFAAAAPTGYHGTASGTFQSDKLFFVNSDWAPLAAVN